VESQRFIIINIKKGYSMKKTLLAISIIISVITINAKSQTIENEKSSPLKMNVELKSNSASIDINGVIIVPAIQFYFSNRGWKNIYTLNASKMKISQENGKNIAQISQDAKGIGNYDLKISWAGKKVEIDYEYDIPANNEVKYCVADIFLAKNLFYKGKKNGIKKAPDNQFSAFASANDMEIQTDIGLFKFTLKTERLDKESKPSEWLVRDTTPQKFRAEILRSLSILNCLERNEKNPAKEKLKAVIEYFPSENVNDIFQAKYLLELTKKLKEESSKLKLTCAGELSSLEKEFKSLLKKGGFDKNKYQEASKKLQTLAKEISLKKQTYSHENIIIPQPQKTELSDGNFKLKKGLAIIIPEKPSKGAKNGAKLLKEELKDYFGIDSEITTEKNADKENSIYIGSIKDGTFKELCKTVNITPPEKEEGYILKVDKNRAIIAGSDSEGAFYGIQSLLQILRKNNEGNIIAPCMTVTDWPETKVRGMMLIPGRTEKSFVWLKRAIRRMMARYKFNFLVLGEASSGNVRWKSHPEIAKKYSMSVETLKENVDYAKDHLLEVAPLVQSLGHSKTVLKAHPDLADSPDPNYPGNALCISNPKTRKFLADIYDEVLEIYGNPKYFHIGFDEAMTIGKNPLCKGKKPSQLVAEQVKWCNDYLKGKGVKNVIMWHDMLLEHKTWKDVPANSNQPGVYDAITHPAVTKLPKDVIIAMWSYSNTGTFPSVPYFQKHGYQVLCCPWFDEKNNYDIAASAKRNNALGILGTSWTFTTWLTPGTTSILCEENAWTPGKPEFENLPYDSRERLQSAMLPPCPSSYADTKTIPLDIRKSCNRSLHDTALDDGKGWADEGPMFDMSLLPEGKNKFGGIDFEIIPFDSNKDAQCIAVSGKNLSKKWGTPEEQKNIIIASKAKSLIFLQTCLYTTSMKDLGAYIIKYDDGTRLSVPIANRENIFSARKSAALDKPFMKRVYNGYISGAKKIWTGWNKAGEEIDLQAYEWINPHPDKTIKSIDMKVAKGCPNEAIFLLGITLVK
jgi:hypothetical protein